MKRKLLFFFLLLISSVLLFSFGIRDRSVPTIQVTGIVRLVGTSNFPEIVITNDENTWVITNEDMYKLHDYQHRKVTVEGIETVTELFFANGLPARARRELSNIRIITIH